MGYRQGLLQKESVMGVFPNEVSNAVLVFTLISAMAFVLGFLAIKFIFPFLERKKRGKSRIKTAFGKVFRMLFTESL